MKDTLQIIELILAVLLMVVILLQQRGTGIGGAFGSEGFAFRSRRGAERFLFNATIFFGVIFVVIAVALLILSRT